MCVVSTTTNKKRFPLSTTVFNTLTMQWRQLPPHDLSSVQPRMIRLGMDQESKSYKVIVLGPKDERGGGAVGAIVYSCVTRTWSSSKAFIDLIIGIQFTGKQHPFVCVQVGPCAYDCANDTRLERGPGKPWHAATYYALVKD